MKKTLFLMATVALMVASCGDNKKPEEAGQTTEQPAATEAPAADQAAEAVNVTLEGTDQMTFNIQEIKCLKIKWDTTSYFLRKVLIFLLSEWLLWKLVLKRTIFLTMELM